MAVSRYNTGKTGIVGRYGQCGNYEPAILSIIGWHNYDSERQVVCRLFFNVHARVSSLFIDCKKIGRVHSTPNGGACVRVKHLVAACMANVINSDDVSHASL